MTGAGKLMYDYKYAECSECGEQRLDGDSHDGEASTGSFCCAPVTFHTAKSIADEAFARTRTRK